MTAKRLDIKTATGGSTCRLCEKRIEQGEMTIMPWAAIQYHPRCLLKEVLRCCMFNTNETEYQKLKKEIIVECLEK
jgi:hypothetical protein